MKIIKKLIIILLFFTTFNTYAPFTSNVKADSLPQSQVSNVSVSDYLKNTASFTQVNASEVDSFFDKNDNVNRYLYIGRPSCYYCRQFSPTLAEFNKLVNGKLYYLNLDSSKDNINYAFDNLQIPGTPTTMLIKNGDIANAWVGGGKNAQELYDFLNNK